ncbi:MAG: tyrosine-type recombinase/integrase [Anaerolineaceae bacterium]|nr:tyrosine-type recombinase/integrase [Anaerolineaceae bacterium]
MNQLAIISHDGYTIPAHLETLANEANKKIHNAKSKNTLIAYRSDWRHFTQWCEKNGLDPLPASVGTVVLYVTACAPRYKLSTIQRRLTAISQRHKTQDLEPPTSHKAVHSLLASIQRETHYRPNKKEALHLSVLNQLMEHVPDGLKGVRDRAILLVGFWGCLRRSEIANLNVDDITFTDEGVTIAVQYSKTDQSGKGEKVGLCYRPNVATCPVRALQRWLEASGLTDGALFRHVKADAIKPYVLKKGGKVVSVCESITGTVVAHAVKKYAKKAGLDAANFSGHSLRRGFAVQADKSRVSFAALKKHGRWRHDGTVRGYQEQSDLWTDNATASIQG